MDILHIGRRLLRARFHVLDLKAISEQHGRERTDAISLLELSLQ
jgi:hypothetical protein